MTNYLLSIDGALVVSAATPYETRFPHSAWAEQDPRDWWWVLGMSVREMVLHLGVSPEAIAVMAVDTTCCSVVALDCNGNP